MKQKNLIVKTFLFILAVLLYVFSVPVFAQKLPEPDTTTNDISYTQAATSSATLPYLGDSLPSRLTGDFTIELWVNPAAAQFTYANILDFNHRANTGMVFQQNGSQTNYFSFGIGNGYTGAGVSCQLQANVWQHIAFEREQTTLRLYINGNLVATQPCFEGPIYYLPGSNVTVGWNVNYLRPFLGDIKGIGIWDRVKSQAEIQMDVNNTDHLIFRTNVCILGNGKDSRFNLGNAMISKLTGDFTIEMRVQPRTPEILQPTNYQNIMDFNHRENIGMVFQQNDFQPWNYNFGVGNGATSAVINYDLVDNRWYHIAFVRQGTEIRLYRSGQLVATQPCFAGPVYFLPGSNVTVGYNANYGRYFRGAIKDIRCWDYARGSSEINNDYKDIESKLILQSRANFTCNGVDSQYNLGDTITRQLIQDFTIDMWVKPGDTQEPDANILDCSHTDYSGLVIQQNGAQTNNYIFKVYGLYDASGASINYPLQANVWQHVAFVRSGTILQLYINGNLVETQPCFPRENGILWDSNVTVGYRANYGCYFNGSIKNITIWNEALDPGDIQNDMNQ